MSGFEPRISGVGSNHSTNSATATAQGFTSSCYFVKSTPGCHDDDGNDVDNNEDDNDDDDTDDVDR